MLGVNSSISHYRILSKIGAGGMGEVYLAQDTKLERQVALKILPGEFSQDAERMRRFVQEAKSASALNHPSIITIHEIGEADGSHFIAAEYVEGETLSQRLRTRPMPLQSALEVAIQIASALQAAHNAGIVHRDIKPDNVMIRPDGLVKILDFGIAKLATKNNQPIDEEASTAIKAGTNPGMIIGTAAYMSPEQARGTEVDARTDIFSFGVVLYQMLTTKRPFAGENEIDVIGSILHKDPTPIRELSPDLPKEIERVVTKMLRKDREERYQTSKDLLIDLKDARQEIDLQSRLARTTASSQKEPGTAGGSPRLSETTPDVQHTTSSAEYLLGEIGKHKRGLVWSALLLIMAAAGLGYWSIFVRSASGRQIESIAVMPFVNESGKADVEYLSDGMTETLIGSLSQLPRLNVKARSLVFRYKNKDVDARTIGRELSVQALLNGRVVQYGDDLTLYLELVDAQTGDRIWGDQYKRKQTDLVSLQSEIALEVSQKLQTKLSGVDEQKLTKKYTENAEAYELYLKGRYFMNRRTSESLQTAIGYFNQAIAIDANYALGYGGLADTYLLLGLPDAITGALSPRDSLPKARVAAEKALLIDNSVGEVYFSLGQIKTKELDWDGAESAFDRGLKLSPNYAQGRLFYAVYLSNLGRHNDAVREIKRAQELDPLSLPINASVVYVLYLAREYDEAIEVSKKTLEMDPTFSLTHQRLGMAYVQKKMYQDAIAEFQEAAKNSNRAPLAIVSLGYAYAASGNKVEAQRVLGELRDLSQSRYISAYSVATIYAALGQTEEAFQLLEKAALEGNTEFVFIRVDPRLDPLRNDPRFQELVKKVKFPS